MLSIPSDFAGKHCVAAISARATSRPILHATWWSTAVHLSACFMVYSCGEKHSGARSDLFPFFNVFTRLNKHILKERRHQPCWE